MFIMLIMKLSNIIVQALLLLLPNILEVIPTEIEGSMINKDETCDIKGKVSIIDILIYML